MNTAIWTATTRAQHTRDGLRFANDLTDAEWAVLEPLLQSAATTGRSPAWPLCELVNAMFYVLRGGIQWRMLPPCFPPRQTVYGWFAAWRDAGVWQSINHRLIIVDRERAGLEASPSAAMIDSQSVKTTEAGGPYGSDAGKKIKGRKRHAMVDTDGRALTLQVGFARVQGRDGAVPLLQESRRGFPFSSTLMQTRPMPLSGCGMRPASPSRSFARYRVRSGSRCIRAGVSWKVASPGRDETAVWQRISRPPSPQLPPSSTSLKLCS